MPDTTLSYVTLFGWSFLAATVVPLGSEPALFALVLSGHRVWLLVSVATLGNVLGGCTTYWLGRRGAIALQHRGARPLDETRAGRLIGRFGQPVLLLSWVPLIGDALVATAGAVRMPFLPFLLWLSIGKAVRYLLVASAAGWLR